MAFDNNFPSMPYTTLSSSYFNSCSSAHGAFMTISVPCTKLKFAPSILGTSWKMAFSSAVQYTVDSSNYIYSAVFLPAFSSQLCLLQNSEIWIPFLNFVLLQPIISQLDLLEWMLRSPDLLLYYCRPWLDNADRLVPVCSLMCWEALIWFSLHRLQPLCVNRLCFCYVFRAKGTSMRYRAGTVWMKTPFPTAMSDAKIGFPLSTF